MPCDPTTSPEHNQLGEEAGTSLEPRQQSAFANSTCCFVHAISGSSHHGWRRLRNDWIYSGGRPKNHDWRPSASWSQLRAERHRLSPSLSLGQAKGYLRRSLCSDHDRRRCLCRNARHCAQRRHSGSRLCHRRRQRGHQGRRAGHNSCRQPSPGGGSSSRLNTPIFRYCRFPGGRNAP